MAYLAGAVRRLRRYLLKLSTTVRWAPRRAGKRNSRIGVYVAYYDAAEIFDTHLASFQRLTTAPFNYYVTKNCTSELERERFDAAIKKYDFATVFDPWPATMPMSHAESLQWMVNATAEEVIVVCDVDAFPICRSWDKVILKELETKDVVGIVCYMPGRAEFEFVMHPSFLAFRRSYLVRNGLDLGTQGDNDPAYKITKHLVESGRFSPAHVMPLLPTHHELELFADRSHSLMFGSKNLSHGFGTTYGDLVFHLWFWTAVRKRIPVRDAEGKVIVDQQQMETVLRNVQGKYGAS